MTTQVYIISVAAEMTGMHPQTLRAYDRLGLVKPGRTVGLDRRYTSEDIERLLHVRGLAKRGVNLAGIQEILHLEARVEALEEQLKKSRRPQYQATPEEIEAAIQSAQRLRTKLEGMRGTKPRR